MKSNTVETIRLKYPKHILRPEDFLTFYEMDGFLADWTQLGFDDDDLQHVQLCVMAGPEKADLIPGTGGLRQLRFETDNPALAPVTVRFVYFPEFSIVLLVIPYTGRSTLTADETEEIKNLIERERNALNNRCST